MKTIVKSKIAKRSKTVTARIYEPVTVKASELKVIGRFSLAGVQFSDYQALPDSAFVHGADLTLVQEPTNRFDSGAIKVFLNDTRIGYIPKAKPADLIDFQCLINDAIIDRKPISLRLVAYNKNNPTWHLITVELAIAD